MGLALVAQMANLSIFGFGELEKRSAYRRVVNKCIDEFSLSAKSGTIKQVVTTEIEDIKAKTEQIRKPSIAP